MRSDEDGDERFPRHGLLAQAALVGTLAAVYMAISTGLISFNKYLMHEDRFPFAICLALVHMTSSFGFNGALLCIRPSLFPSLADPVQRADIDRYLVAKVLLPIACCFAAQLVLSNLAYMHSSLAFVQMMKESNVVLVYLFSVALTLDYFSWKRGAVLLFIVSATVLTIHGEMHLSYEGFMIQGISIICESMKLTLQSYALSVTGKRLDALTYVLLVTPLVILVLGALLLAFQCLWPEGPNALQVPTLTEIFEYRWLLVASACLAFGMNVSHAAFIKQSSAITFILMGVLLKDVLIVGAGAAFMGDQLSSMQVVGFAMQLLGILVWSLMKLGSTNDASKSTPECLPICLTRVLPLGGAYPHTHVPLDDSSPSPARKPGNLSRISSDSTSTMVPSTETTDDWEQLLLEDGCLEDESA